MLITKFAHIYTRARVRNQVEGMRSHRFTLYFWLWFESKIDYVYTSKYHGGYRTPSSRSANSHIYALARNQIEIWRSQRFTLYLWLWLTKMRLRLCKLKLSFKFSHSQACARKQNKIVTDIAFFWLRGRKNWFFFAITLRLQLCNLVAGSNKC